MYIAISNVTLQPEKKADFLAWYESQLPHMKELVPGLVSHYVVEMDDESTVMSFGVFESEAAALTPPSSEAQQQLGTPMEEFLAEGYVSERKVHPLLAHLP